MGNRIGEIFNNDEKISSCRKSNVDCPYNLEVNQRQKVIVI